MNLIRWRQVATVFLSIMLIGIGSVVYTNHATNQAIRKANEASVAALHNFCALLLTLEASYVDTAPSTPLGAAIRSNIIGLARAFDCEEHK